jgi:MEMO1 family protein
MDYPKLRNVNIFPVQMSGKTVVCLQDPLNIGEKAVFLPPALYFIVSLFDGRHSALDIQAEYMRNFGEILYTDKINEIIGQLDETLFLEGDRFQEALQRQEEGFKRASVREAAFAGRSYEGDDRDLSARLQGYFTGPEGPGAPGEKGVANGVRGIVSPHIDFQRGGFCYAFAHRELWEKSSPECVIILGTAHTPTRHPYCLTRKDFATPLGLLEADRELIDSIQSRCSYDLLDDEIAHRSEHSVEFQCVFLRFMNPAPAPLRIVPVLCGSFQEAVDRGGSPMDLGPVREFIEVLRDEVSARGERVCVIASADLAHMGLQFGDREGMSDYDLRVLEEEDRDLLRHVEMGEGETFFSSIARERDRRRICGLPSIYTLLQVLGTKEGRLLKYGQAFTRETRSVVSFASLAFH